MLQPVLMIMDVRDGTDRNELGKLLEDTVNGYGLLYKWHVKWAVPLQYTVDVPEGVVSTKGMVA